MNNNFDFLNLIKNEKDIDIDIEKLKSIENNVLKLYNSNHTINLKEKHILSVYDNIELFKSCKNINTTQNFIKDNNLHDLPKGIVLFGSFLYDIFDTENLHNFIGKTNKIYVFFILSYLFIYFDFFVYSRKNVFET